MAMQMEVGSIQELISLAEKMSTVKGTQTVLTGRQLVVTIRRHHLHIRFTAGTNILFTKTFRTDRLETTFRAELHNILENTDSHINLLSTDLFDVDAICQIFASLGIDIIDKVQVYGRFAVTAVNQLTNLVHVKKLALEVQEIDSWCLLNLEGMKNVTLVNLDGLDEYDLTEFLKKHTTVNLEEPVIDSITFNHILIAWQRNNLPNLKALNVTNAPLHMHKPTILSEIMFRPGRNDETWPENFQINNFKNRLAFVYVSDDGKDFSLQPTCITRKLFDNLPREDENDEDH